MIPIHTSSFDTAAEALINELIDLGSFYPDKYRPHSAPVLDTPSQNSRSSRRYHTTLDKAETNQYFFKETRSCIKFNSVRPESSKLQKVLQLVSQILNDKTLEILRVIIKKIESLDESHLDTNLLWNIYQILKSDQYLQQWAHTYLLNKQAKLEYKEKQLTHKRQKYQNTLQNEVSQQKLITLENQIQRLEQEKKSTDPIKLLTLRIILALLTN